jgi:hypothetical protein
MIEVDKKKLDVRFEDDVEREEFPTLYNLFVLFKNVVHSMGTNCKFEICNVIDNCIVFLSIF